MGQNYGITKFSKLTKLRKKAGEDFARRGKQKGEVGRGNFGQD
jgi:hypothetical protein